MDPLGREESGRVTLIALDTNLVVRLLVEDDVTQVRQVRALLEEAKERGESCLVTNPVLCETEWVLESAYNASRGDVTAAVQQLLASAAFSFENLETVRRALELYQTGRGDFSDYLLGLTGEAGGASTTYTFDKALRGTAQFTVM